MDGPRFDALHRQLAGGRRGIVAGALAFLGAAATPALTSSKGGKKKGDGGKKGKDRDKVTICHLGTTLRVSPGVAAAHLAHGDSRGACGLGDPANTCTCCPGSQEYFPEANLCCPSGQIPAGGVCCAPENICNDNQGKPTCCQHRCLAGVCCPCDMISSCQQCVVDIGKNPPQASCETYCAAGQYCTPGGCAAPVT